MLRFAFFKNNIMSDEFYKLITSRNLGLLDEEEQEILKNSKVAICGLGGVGGPVAENLVRMGIGDFTILDHGTFEPTNSNRQVYSFTDTNGKWKTDVTEEYFHKINPSVKVEKFTELTQENVNDFLNKADLTILAVDALIPILILSRAARLKGIPLIESWALAFGNVRVFTKDTPSLEEVYNFPTIGRGVDEISVEEQAALLEKSIFDVAASFDGIMEHYPEHAIRKMKEESVGTTLAPMVWLSSIMMAIESYKILLGKRDLALAPSFQVFDPFRFICFKT